jgi:hypothetical protein
MGLAFPNLIHTTILKLTYLVFLHQLEACTFLTIEHSKNAVSVNNRFHHPALGLTCKKHLLPQRLIFLQLVSELFSSC